MKKALIFGVTGQDGSYLTELLLSKGYHVTGIRRRSSSDNCIRIQHLLNDHSLSSRLKIIHGDILDSSSIAQILQDEKPQEIYNLAAQSHVGVSFETPDYTSQVTALGALRILEGIKRTGIGNCRFYQASSSEMFGNSQLDLQSELTPMNPVSPYAIAKLFAHNTTKMYREAYGIFAVSGILFNHESPRRGENFVTRKITKFVANYKPNENRILELGNLDSQRDWGHAREYVDAMNQMLSLHEPQDYVIATGVTTTVRDFLKLAFSKIDIEIQFEGTGTEEFAFDKHAGHRVVQVNADYYRPSELNYLKGDFTKATQDFNWKPKTSLDQIVEEMVESDRLATIGKLH